MKLRNTIILLLIAAGVYCYMRYYETNQPTTQEAEDIGGHVVQMDGDKIDGITITNNETKIALRKRNNEWQMDEPVKDRADQAAVETLLSSVESLEKETSLNPAGDKEDEHDLGLVKPNVTLQLLGEKAPPEIMFGKDTAIEGNLVHACGPEVVFQVLAIRIGKLSEPGASATGKCRGDTLPSPTRTARG